MKRPSLMQLLALLFVLTACGARARGPLREDIASIRSRLLTQTTDIEAQRELAAAEYVLPGGATEGAKAAIDRGLAVRANDPLLHVLAGLLEADTSGQRDPIVAHWRAAIEGFRSIEDAKAYELFEVLTDLVIGHAAVEPDFAPFDADFEAITSIAHLPVGVRSQAAITRVGLAARTADKPRAVALARSAGCVESWRVAGPFGPRELLGFDAPSEALGRGPMRESYDLGVGRGVAPVRTMESRGCAANVGSTTHAVGGVTIAEANVRVEETGRYALRVETPNAVEVYVDGDRVLRRDSRAEAMPRVSFVFVDLTTGEHEFELKIASRHANPAISLVLTKASPANEAFARNDARDPLSLFAHAGVQRLRGDAVTARETLIDFGADAEQSVEVLEARIVLAGADPWMPEGVRRDEQRRLLALALEKAPNRPYLRSTIAGLAASDNQTIEAIAAFRALRREVPNEPEFLLQLDALLRDRGWSAEADRLLEDGRAFAAHDCRLVRRLFDRARERSRLPDATALLPDVLRCDARSYAAFQLHIAARRWEQATAELTRLAALEPAQSRATVLALFAELARAEGREPDAITNLVEIASLLPRSPTTHAALIDAQTTMTTLDSIGARLDAIAARDPSAMASLTWARRLLGGVDDLAPYRKNGLELLRAFEASGRRYDAPQVLVFDYSATRVQEDGSSLSVVHQIYRAQSDEAVDELGEFEVPSGARLLTLRTIKADGRVLEPSQIAGKSSLSLPSLAVGDYVEIEYAKLEEPSTGFPGGFVGDRFYFKSFEVPFDLSQQVVVLPASMPFVVDARGDAPPIENVVSGRERTLTFTARESRALTPEPSSVGAKEFLPSVSVSAHATWESLIEGMRDALADRSPRTPAAARVVRDILGDDADASALEKAKRLYAWSLERIEGTDDFFGLAPSMLASRAGHRTRVLDYLLTLAGVPHTLFAAKSFYADATVSEAADAETFASALIRLDGDIRDEHGEIWLSTSDRGAPFGFLAPGLRGQRALALDGSGASTTTRTSVPNEDHNDARITVTLHQNGGARFDVVETQRGRAAVSWRNDLEGIAEVELPRRFEEAYVARLVPGAVLASVEIEGRSDPEAPITIRYSFDVASYGRRSGDRWLISAPMDANLAQNFAQRPERTTTMLIPSPVDTRIETTFIAPSGARFDELTTREEAGPQGELFRTAARIEGSTLHYDRDVVIPMERIPVETYPRFAAFCRAAERLESAEISLRLAQ